MSIGQNPWASLYPDRFLAVGAASGISLNVIFLPDPCPVHDPTGEDWKLRRSLGRSLSVPGEQA